MNRRQQRVARVAAKRPRRQTELEVFFDDPPADDPIAFAEVVRILGSWLDSPPGKA